MKNDQIVIVCILKLIVRAACILRRVRLYWIVDCWICGVANCPDNLNGGLQSLNSAQVTRDGKSDPIGPNGTTDKGRRVLIQTVVQGTLSRKLRKGS